MYLCVWEEISSEFPDYDTRAVRADGWYATKDFESHEECVFRASRLVRRLRNEVKRLQSEENNDEHNIIIVSHGNFLSEVLKSILGTSNDVGYSCGNASVTKLTLMCSESSPDDTALSVEYIFAVDHLESESLITGMSVKGLYDA